METSPPSYEDSIIRKQQEEIDRLTEQLSLRRSPGRRPPPKVDNSHMCVERGCFSTVNLDHRFCSRYKSILHLCTFKTLI